MEYVVCKPHIFRGERGEPISKLPEDLVQVDGKHIARQLLEQGIIRHAKGVARRTMDKAPSFARAFRVGCFIHTSTFYSGGRIHLFQVAWTLAEMGAEVFLVTDNQPKWFADYPAKKNMILINSKDAQNKGVPHDLDLLFTDGKGWAAQQVMSWKQDHPFIPVVCLNFETPNWVQHFAPEAAPKMPEMKACYSKADLMLCNSGESLKWLAEFMPLPMLTGVLPPAVNTFAVDAGAPTPFETDRPYVVWSSRSSAYKGCAVITQAVQQMDFPCDLVLIGAPGVVPGETKLHRFIKFHKPITDSEKMTLIKGAAAVAAPSKFEGYGMVPGEALVCGTPAVVYDLPVLRQNYGDRLIYAKWNSPADFAAKLTQTIKQRPQVDAAEARTTYGMDAMKGHIAKLPHFNFNRKRISVQMIVFYGQTVQEAIDSVYPYADEILISYGPTVLWENHPEDGTLALLESAPDPDGKIKIIKKKLWRDKTEMRQACQRIMTGNYLLIVDADEIYQGLDKWLSADIDFGCPRWVHYWHDLDHYVVDGVGMDRWGKPHQLGGCTHNHFRWARWRFSNYWYSTRGTVAMDANGNRLTSQAHMVEAVKKCPECCIHHLGHVLDRKLMQEKHEFYLARDGRDKGRIDRMHAWHNWQGKLGNCGDGDIIKTAFNVPELVKRAYARLRK